MTKSITPRTSPKLFRTQAATDDETEVEIKYEIHDEVLPAQKNHSIASQSVSPTQLSHHAAGGRCENDISGIKTTSTATTTGIKQEITGTPRDVKEKMRRKCNRPNNHIKPIERVFVEPISEIPRSAPEWTVINRHFVENLQRNEQPMKFMRDERLRIKKSYLRNVLDRHEGLHFTRKDRREKSKRNFAKICKLLKTLNREKEEM